jgi:molybdopterin converting factor small subunit
MAQLKFTRHLVRFFPNLQNPTAVSGTTIAELIKNIDEKHPGLAAYIIDERGVLRKHVNIFLRGDLIQDRKTLQDAVAPNDEVYIFQALSGG